MYFPKMILKQTLLNAWQLSFLFFLTIACRNVYAHQHMGKMKETTEDSTSAESVPNYYILNPADCSEMEVWDVEMGMCMPLPMAGMPMKMLMIRGNGFLAGISQQGPRGRTGMAAPNMFMADIGSSLGDRHYLNLDLMLTTELWTIPVNGYPELLQIGEENASGQPFIDAQHPHSSPIMGITLSDTIKLGDSTSGNKDHVKVFFAPRGEATDGPVAFMHRTTGMANPDAPLGHHIGQDVGHITSTVLGASLKLADRRYEVSVYNGAEPTPTRVELPLGVPDSFSLRFIEEFSPDWMAMVSYGLVHQPEANQPSSLYESRVSASVYSRTKFFNDWNFYNTLIFGRVTNYDNTSSLVSFAEEFVFRSGLGSGSDSESSSRSESRVGSGIGSSAAPRVWGRIEVLQRTANELGIATVGDPNQGLWVTALTLGYTHRVLESSGLELGLGSSATIDLLPADYASVYGGNPWTAKVFLQVGGMGMWGM